MNWTSTTRSTLTALLTLILLPLSQSYAQSTAEKVYTILQTNCGSCHSGADAAAELNFAASFNEVMDGIIGVTPQNATAAGKGQELIMPGRPYQSFLLRKIGAYGFVHELDGGILEETEGTPMPFYGLPLADKDIELIRQWIYEGAPTNGNIAAEPLIEEYYLDGGIPRLERPEAPAPSQGFQIHLGPIFVAAGDEKEYNVKYDLNLPGELEVNRMDLTINNESHHFILYKFDSESVANNYDDGLRIVGIGFGEELPFGSGTNMVAPWQYSDDVRLPGGTAYFWDETTILDLNYHIPNYSSDLIFPSDVYLNVYTQQAGTAVKEMKSDLLLYGDLIFFIPPGIQVLEEPVYFGGQQRNLWMMTPHTHKLGIDFDVFTLGSGGTPDEQIFEGYFDYNDCNCDLGYYDWEHPPVRYFEPYFQVPGGSGLYHRATYDNYTGSLVTFGLTTEDEMMITMIQYTTGEAIPFVKVAAEEETYCVSTESVALEYMPEGGTFGGPGVEAGIFNPAAAGVGLHTVTYTYEGIESQFDIKVTEALPTEIITVVDETMLTISEGYEYYQWYVDGNPIFGAQSNTYMPSESGNYYVIYQSGACSTTTQPYGFNIVGINNNTPNNTPTIEVYPNPYADFTNINYTLAEPAIVLLDVYNVNGQLVKVIERSRQAAGEYSYQFSAGAMGLPSGMYILNLTVNGQTYGTKLLEK